MMGTGTVETGGGWVETGGGWVETGGGWVGARGGGRGGGDRGYVTVTVRPKRGSDQLEKQAARPPVQQLDSVRYYTRY